MADFAGASDERLATAIDRYVAAAMEAQRVPGLALGAFRQGRAVIAKGYGLANVEHRVPVAPDTVMQSGSIGKCFTATAVMMLVERGMIGLDDAITGVFAEAPASWARITLAHLLSHTSGVGAHDTLERRGRGGAFDLRCDFNEEELVTKVADIPLEFAAGRDWDYSNTGYVLLGILISRLSGLSYADFLKANIFAPLGMASSRVISDNDIVTKRAAGYELQNGVLRNQAWVSPTFNATGDGALYLTVDDLEHFDRALYGTALLRRETLERMWTPYRLASGAANAYGYGLGWRCLRENGELVVEHEGAWQGFSSILSRHVDRGLTITVLTNLMAGPSRPREIARGVIGILDPGLANETPPPRS